LREANLFGFNKIRNMAIVIDASDVEPRPSPLATQSRDNHCFRLFRPGVHGLQLNAAAHDIQQPNGAVDVELLQMHVQRVIPG
jgi:hypothetical protein